MVFDIELQVSNTSIDNTYTKISFQYVVWPKIYLILYPFFGNLATHIAILIMLIIVEKQNKANSWKFSLDSGFVKTCDEHIIILIGHKNSDL